MKNKKGDVAITILVIGVIGICGFALFSFLNSSIYSRQKFIGIEEMNKLNYEVNEYYFYKEKGFSNDEISTLINLEEDKISVSKTSKKLFGLIEGEFLFSVEYYPK